VVLAWKGPGERSVARAVRGAAFRAGRALALELEAAQLLPPSRLLVVPAPSGWRRRAAGRFVVGSLAVAVGRGLREGLADGSQPGQSRPDVVVVDALRRGRGSAHQSGLGAAGRSANRRRSMRLVRPLPPASTCLLVDDVVTTGATLAECRRTLEAGGHGVIGAFVLAAARLPADGSRGTS
jgi:phosphoribosylpyrophosphate synthetase